ncbi:MAG: DUF4384 domain-containing protein [Bryobacterales bacterium]|nr:DUF4384 domain-containing protein [Bryobacterales bacterium]
MRQLARFSRAAVYAACLVWMLAAAVPATASDARKVEVLLEKWVSQSWQPVDPGYVLHAGDRVRFRFSSNFDGYLYVTNLGTSGRYELLFPTSDTGADNRVEAGKSYLVPATQAQFIVAGPAGHDISFWMVSPKPLESLELLPAGGAPAAPRVPPHRMKPRCDDSLFRARGECIDSSAGLRSVPDSKTLPESWEKLPRMQARELFFMRNQEKQVISAPGKMEGPMIYEFRIAHD